MKMCRSVLLSAGIILLLMTGCSTVREPFAPNGIYKVVVGGAFVSLVDAEHYMDLCREFFVVSNLHGVTEEHFVYQGETGVVFVSDNVLKAVIDINDIVRNKISYEQYLQTR